MATSWMPEMTQHVQLPIIISPASPEVAYGEYRWVFVFCFLDLVVPMGIFPIGNSGGFPHPRQSREYTQPQFIQTSLVCAVFFCDTTGCEANSSTTDGYGIFHVRTTRGGQTDNGPVSLLQRRPSTAAFVHTPLSPRRSMVQRPWLCVYR